MEQGVSAVITAMLVVFVFIPALFMGMLNSNRQKVNESMYLATKCLEDCVVYNNSYSDQEIAMGYGYSDDAIMRVRVDEAKCFMEFDNILFKNIGSIKNYSKIRNNILCEMIIYPDRYVVYDTTHLGGEITKYSEDEDYEKYEQGKIDLKVTSPKYFTYKRVNEEKNRDDEIVPLIDEDGNSGYYYINTINDKVRKMGTTDSWKNIDDNISGNSNGKRFTSKLHYKYETDEINIVDFTSNKQEFITTYDKNQVIIDTLNKEIKYYTNGVKMDFINPASVKQKNIKAEKKDFNFFNGITFLVIYREDNIINSGNTFFNFNQYTAAGYTLEN